MKAVKFAVYGNPFIGIYARATDRFAIVGRGVVERFEHYKASEILKVPLVGVSISDSDLAGIYAASNRNGILLPPIISEKECERLKEQLSECGSGINVEILNSKFTALGNCIASNSKGALVSPAIKDKRMLRTIGDVLGVEVAQRTIAGYSLPGGMILVTEKGFIAHPKASENELKFIEELFGVRGGIGTANMGVPFPSISIVANSNGYLAGEATSGFEMHRINECLDFI
jgi:translation initiation factor 6